MVRALCFVCGPLSTSKVGKGKEGLRVRFEEEKSVCIMIINVI